MASSRPWRDALNRVIAQDEDGKKLRAAAEWLLSAAASGDIGAIRELADRLDGKPHQTLSGPEDRDLVPPSITVRFVKPDNGSTSS